MAHRPFSQERSSHRPAKFAQRIKEELIELVPRRLRDPRLENITMLTFTDVSITPDLKYSTVLFTLNQLDQPRSREIEAALNHAAGFLRHELMLKLDTKITPHIKFKYDKGLENTMEIDALLKSIKSGNE